MISLLCLSKRVSTSVGFLCHNHLGGQREKVTPMAADEESWDNSSSKIRMDEISPLLSAPASPSSAAPPPPNTDAGQRRRWRVYVVAFILVVCVNLSLVVFEPAQARLFESALCRAWYQEHNPAMIGPGGVDEMHCKIPHVQQDVASLSGKGVRNVSSVDRC